MIIQRTQVEGLGEVSTSRGNLVENVQDLRGGLFSVRKEVYARVKTAETDNLGKTEGVRIAVEFDYIKDDVPVATKYDKLSLVMAKRAVEANSKNQYLCTNSTRRYDTKRKTADREEKSGVPCQERSAIILPRDSFNMSNNENPLLFAFFFEDMAKQDEKGSVPYLVLNNGPVACYPLDKDIVNGKKDTRLLQNPNGTIIVPYGWFWSLDYRSGLFGYDWSAFNCYCWARGVLEKSGEATSQKIKQASLGEIIRYSKRFVPEAARTEFETGLRSILKR